MAFESENVEFFNDDVLELPADALNGFRGFATDIGGTLAKLAYTEETNDPNTLRIRLRSSAQGEIDPLLLYLKENIMPLNSQLEEGKLVVATAGWAAKMAEDKYKHAFGLSPICIDEFESYGHAFKHLIDILGPEKILSRNIITCPAKEHWATMEELRNHMVDSRENREDFIPEKEVLFPALVGFIGSGIGFTKIEADGQCSDIHLGSMTGGMFFYGMGRVLTDCQSYDELQSMVNRGNPAAISDVLSDIPSGTKYQMYDFDLMKEAFSHLGESLVLPFGKLGRGEIKKEDVNKEDLVASLLHTVCYEIMEQAVLFARWHGARSLFFCGSFTRNNKIFSDYVQRAPLFDMMLTGPELVVGQLKHEGYISALGCLLKVAREINDK